ncbi:MAG: glycosyltransferase family 2 protein [Thermodesulfovibrionales bacterium]
MTPVSVCCLTFNSERTIRKTLESVKKIADEIIVVDSFSTDRTIEIVKEFTDKIYFKEYKYHGMQMNYAIELCTYDWVFCLDSDECLDDDMIQHICRLKEEWLEGKEAFRLRREWFFLGRPVHAFYPITSPDRIIRFFNRKYVRFNEKPVHDKPVGHKKCDWLEGKLIHETIYSLNGLYDKLNKYTTRYAEGNASKADSVKLRNLLINPFAAFIKWYFLKKNFLDGTQGFILAMYAGFYTFFKYAKLFLIKIDRNLL